MLNSTKHHAAYRLQHIRHDPILKQSYPFATVVALRDKLRRGKKLEPWEREFYRGHRAEVDLHRPASPEADAEKQRLLALLNEDEGRGT